jgi:hypothetical protein
MIACHLKSESTVPVPGNNGNKHAVSYKLCSRRSHFNWEQTYRPGHVRFCSQSSREQREQYPKLRPYLFPLFPGTGKDISHS